MSYTKEMQEFVNYLEQKGVPYSERSERSIEVCYSGENLEGIDCVISIGTTETCVFALLSFYDFPAFEGEVKGYIACNDANDDAAVARFYIDEDNDVVANCCVYYPEALDPAQLLTQLEMFASDVDDAYPFFENAMQ